MTDMQDVVTMEAGAPRGVRAAVEVYELRKVFKRRDSKRGQPKRPPRIALDGVSFAIERGETVAILGQNGSGKSTLVRLLSTLLLPDGGSASIFGHDVVSDERAVRRLVNRVSVEASFFKKMSSAENLSYAARFYGMTSGQTRDKIPELLERVGVVAALEIFRGLECKQAAPIEDADALRESLSLGEVVRAEQDGRVVGRADLADELLHLELRARVEPRRRLVEKEHHG